MANDLLVKAVLGLTSTFGLIERLTICAALLRIGGSLLCKALPSETIVARALVAFADAGLAERVHEALIEEPLRNEPIGQISRNGTAIEARERPYWTETAVRAPAAGSSGQGDRAIMDANAFSQESAMNAFDFTELRRHPHKCRKQRQQAGRINSTARARSSGRRVPDDGDAACRAAVGRSPCATSVGFIVAPAERPPA